MGLLSTLSQLSQNDDFTDFFWEFRFFLFFFFNLDFLCFDWLAGGCCSGLWLDELSTAITVFWSQISTLKSKNMINFGLNYLNTMQIPTDSTKINHSGHNIHMYWLNFRQPTAHVQQNILGKTPIEVWSPHLYASFGAFCVQIGQLFAA